MAEEVELKLEVDPAAVDDLSRSELFEGEPTITQQRSVYFDTEDDRLLASGFSLRIRTANGKRVQTVKASKSAAVGLYARPEWEFPVEGDTPVIDHATPLKARFGASLEELVPQFEVIVERRIWIVTKDSSEIEVAVDIGHVQAGDRRTPICEIEFELKAGEPKALFELVRRLASTARLRLGSLSKAERGYALLGPMKMAFKADDVELDKDISAPKSFQMIAYACLRQYRLNEAILLSRENTEALHQARVALRRLRSAFSVFKPILADPEAERLKGELQWLASVFGEARNIDVLLKEQRDDDVRQRLTAARLEANREVHDNLDSDRATGLMLDLSEWLSYVAYLQSPTDSTNAPIVPVFAISSLDRLRAKIKKHGKGFADADDEHRHDVRKDAKKLRYAAEFFKSLFDGKKEQRRYERFIKLMEILQDRLGVLNDLATQPSVFAELDIPQAGLRQGKDKKRLIDEAKDALDALLEAKRFWR